MSTEEGARLRLDPTEPGRDQGRSGHGPVVWKPVQLRDAAQAKAVADTKATQEAGAHRPYTTTRAHDPRMARCERKSALLGSVAPEEKS